MERIGKAIRKQIGYGWGFGLHEALDQCGALFGPLAVAAALGGRGDYRTAFEVLLAPTVVTLSMLVIARFLYPRPEDPDVYVPNVEATGQIHRSCGGTAEHRGSDLLW